MLHIFLILTENFCCYSFEKNILKYWGAQLTLFLGKVLMIIFPSLVSDPERFMPVKYSVHGDMELNGRTTVSC